MQFLSKFKKSVLGAQGSFKMCAFFFNYLNTPLFGFTMHVYVFTDFKKTILLHIQPTQFSFVSSCLEN